MEREGQYDDRAGGLEFAVGVGFSEEARRSTQCNGCLICSTESSGETIDELGSLAWGEERWWVGRHDIVPIQVDKESLMLVTIGSG